MAGRVTTPALRVGGNAWLALVLSAGGQTASAVLQSAPAFLVPEAVRGLHMSLPAAGMLAVAPTLGGALTLVLWGSIADRFSNRWVFAAGLALATVALAAALPARSGTVLTGWLCAAGAAAAASNASSGRVIIGWFPPRRRGLAMGIRQMSAPLGAAVAALSVPVALEAGGLRLALAVPLGFLAVFTVGVAWLLRDPPLGTASNPPTRASSPYREGSFLWRVHAASTLAVVPQLMITTFAVAWLVLGFGWRPAAAGLLAGAAHLLAGVVRVLIGSWSDLRGTRMPLMRLVLAAGAVALVLLGLGSVIGAPAVALGLVVTTVTTQMPNGLAFTAVAERAGPRWSGRAIGFQNTGQFVVTTAVGPLGGAAITWLGYGAAVGLTAALSAAAVLVAPGRDEHAKEEWS